MPAKKSRDTVLHTVVDITNGVREVIEYHLGAAKAAMTEDARFTDFGADSIDLYEVVMSLEEKFDINIDDRDAQRLTMIGDAMTQLVEKGDPDRTRATTMNVLEELHAVAAKLAFNDARPTCECCGQGKLELIDERPVSIFGVLGMTWRNTEARLS